MLFCIQSSSKNVTTNCVLTLKENKTIINVFLCHVDYVDYPTSKDIPPKFCKKIKQACNFGNVLINTPVQS